MTDSFTAGGCVSPAVIRVVCAGSPGVRRFFSSGSPVQMRRIPDLNIREAPGTDKPKTGKVTGVVYLPL